MVVLLWVYLAITNIAKLATNTKALPPPRSNAAIFWVLPSGINSPRPPIPRIHDIRSNSSFPGIFERAWGFAAYSSAKYKIPRGTREKIAVNIVHLTSFSVMAWFSFFVLIPAGFPLVSPVDDQTLSHVTRLGGKTIRRRSVAGVRPSSAAFRFGHSSPRFRQLLLWVDSGCPPRHLSRLTAWHGDHPSSAELSSRHAARKAHCWRQRAGLPSQRAD
jgi:hypothetical protein